MIADAAASLLRANCKLAAAPTLETLNYFACEYEPVLESGVFLRASCAFDLSGL